MNNKIDLTQYIKNEKPKLLTKKVPTPDQKKRQAGIYLGLTACGNLMLDYMSELNEMNEKLGYKPSDILLEGQEGVEKFVTELTEVFASVVDLSSNISFPELQNRINYTIMKELKYTPNYLKK